MTCLLQEILRIFPLLNPASLTTSASNRACNALALLQCIASHDDTRDLFFESRLPLYLYPFLNTTIKTKPYEYIRLTSLGVIGALVKNDSPGVIDFLLKTEIIPLCLRILDVGTELSKTVSLFIIQKIISSDSGISYISSNVERLDAICTLLGSIITGPFDPQMNRVVKHAVKCFHYMSMDARCLEYVKRRLSDKLASPQLMTFVSDDPQSKVILTETLANIHAAS